MIKIRWSHSWVSKKKERENSFFHGKQNYHFDEIYVDMWVKSLKFRSIKHHMILFWSMFWVIYLVREKSSPDEIIVTCDLLTKFETWSMNKLLSEREREGSY